ncbi:hypothetical protein [Methylobacterium aquaticum]|uniref:Uncharacterized protein n=1 Tax=Methylobacterium aquaticum TaxID=270351 RepID=A0A0C6FR89_9HYPH|nr:hypothetical protein [Methylobacterium aquaticum]BAQ49592.1 hypothetical protein Maq22A_1p36995 [Methylobacterium aquaticum]
MEAVQEWLSGALAFLLACRERWPEIGIGAVIAWVWAMSRRRLPHVRRWAIRNDKRHYVDILIIVAIILFVSISAYIDLWRETHIEEDITINMPIYTVASLLEDKLEMPIFVHNKGNRNILLQQIGMYLQEYNDDKFMGTFDYKDVCPPMMMQNPVIYDAMPRDPNGTLWKNVGYMDYYRPELVNFGGADNKFGSFTAPPKTSMAGSIRFGKHKYSPDRGNITIACFVFRYFDAKSDPHAAVCKGTFVAILRHGPGGPTIYGAGTPPYRLLPELDTRFCKKLY